MLNKTDTFNKKQINKQIQRNQEKIKKDSPDSFWLGKAPSSWSGKAPSLFGTLVPKFVTDLPFCCMVYYTKFHPSGTLPNAVFTNTHRGRLPVDRYGPNLSAILV